MPSALAGAPSVLDEQTREQRGRHLVTEVGKVSWQLRMPRTLGVNQLTGFSSAVIAAEYAWVEDPTRSRQSGSPLPPVRRYTRPALRTAQMVEVYQPAPPLAVGTPLAFKCCRVLGNGHEMDTPKESVGTSTDSTAGRGSSNPHEVVLGGF